MERKFLGIMRRLYKRAASRDRESNYSAMCGAVAPLSSGDHFRLSLTGLIKTFTRKPAAGFLTAGSGLFDLPARPRGRTLHRSLAGETGDDDFERVGE